MSSQSMIDSARTTASWTQLIRQCQECINMSVRLQAILNSKTSNKKEIPALLNQINEQADDLKEGIRIIAVSDSDIRNSEGNYKELTSKMEELIFLKKTTFELVHSKGIPLNIPKIYKYNRPLRHQLK